MKLNLTQLAGCLEILPDTLERWIRQGRIPVRKKGEHYIFSSRGLKQWAEIKHMPFHLPGSAESSEATSKESAYDFLGAAKRGGIYYSISGHTVMDVLRNAVDHVPGFETPGRKKALYEGLIAREQMMSTGIGKGVAIPHPRTPLGYMDIPPSITACFLENEVDYHSLDHQPVFVLFLLVSPTSKIHLHILARLSFCLRDQSFLEMLRTEPDSETFFKVLSEFDDRFALFEP